MRFSVSRVEKALKKLTLKQRGFLIKHGYDMVLNLKNHVVFPLPLIDFVMENMVPAFAMIQLGNKRINLDKTIIQQFIGPPSGDSPVKYASDNPDIIAKVNMLKEKYMDGGGKLHTKRAIDLLDGDEDEESFMRTFLLVFMATFLCPATSNSVDWKLLYSLTDVSMMIATDWYSLCLECIVTEVAKFIVKLRKYPSGIPNKALYVGGCLPVFWQLCTWITWI